MESIRTTTGRGVRLPSLPLLSLRALRLRESILSDETEEKLRQAIFMTKGMKKGNISQAIEEAIEMWIQEQLRKAEKKTK
jgi:hypothetical protein